MGFLNEKTKLVHCLLGFLSLLIFLVSCEAEKEPSADLGYNYYKVAVGQMNTFAVDSIYFSGVNNSSDTVHCFIREIITERISEINGSKTFKVNAYVSYDTMQGWKWTDNYYYRTDTNTVQKIEGNTSRAIFVYPVLKNKKWNINLYNSQPEEFAYFRKVDYTYDIYSHCAEIVFKEDINFIEERKLTEIYSKNTGLISRYISDLSINNTIKDGIMVNFKRVN